MLELSISNKELFPYVVMVTDTEVENGSYGNTDEFGMCGSDDRVYIQHDIGNRFDLKKKSITSGNYQ